jgi:hypothetical protein
MSKLDVLDQFTKHRKDNKSTVFLYAILQLEDICKPLNTYLYLNQEEVHKDRYLFAMFNSSQEGYSKCKKQIEGHELWDFCLTDENGFDIHVFTLEKYFKYFDQILSGNYAAIETEFKLILGHENHPIAAIGMHPEEYHSNYCNAFGIPEPDLPIGTQLIQRPSIENETLNVSPDIMRQFDIARGVQIGVL